MVGEGIAAGKYRRVTGHVGQADHAAAGQRVFGCGNEIQRVVPYRDRMHRFAGLRGQGDHRQLGAAMQDFFVGHFGVEKLDVQRHLRVRAGEGAQQGRQTVQADVVAGGQGQAAADLAAEIVQGAAGIVQHIEDLVGAWQQGAAGLGQAHLAAQTVEQAYIELLFQAGDALAHGRLGQVQAFGGIGEAALLGDGDKGIEGGEIHDAIAPSDKP
ncbi:hypothetical protein D3C85_1021060 [compost metagenome]